MNKYVFKRSSLKHTIAQLFYLRYDPVRAFGGDGGREQKNVERSPKKKRTR